MTDQSISPLRRRMIEDMTIRKLAPKTQASYIRSIKNFTVFVGRSPDTASAEDLRRYQLHLASGGAHYTASKAGLIGFTRHAAVQLAAYGIRVSAVCPGPVATPMVEGTSEDVMRLLPLGRWLDPQDVANAVLFFAGPMSKMCTGTNLDVDGGYRVTFGIPFDEYFESRGVAFSPRSRPQE